MDPHKAVKNYIKAAGKGVLKVMSKMGVSRPWPATPARRSSRRSASAHELVDEYFTGTVSRLGGIGLDEIAAEVAVRHAIAHPDPARGAGPPQARARRRVPVAARGRVHLFNPETVFKLQHATRAKRYDIFKQYTALVDDQSKQLATLRGLFELRPRRTRADPDRRGRAGQRDRQAVLDRRDELRLDLAPRPTRRSRSR